MKRITILLFLLTLAALLYIPFRYEWTTATITQEEGRTYLAQHITELSPEKAVLGGTWYVTDFQFTGNDQGIVWYEDGHIALVADVTFEKKGGALRVKDFLVRK